MDGGGAGGTGDEGGTDDGEPVAVDEDADDADDDG